MELDMCLNCDEEESVEDGALCQACRTEMWEGVCEHGGTLDPRSIEDVTRANGQR